MNVYESLANQSYHFAHFVLAIIVGFTILPRYMFQTVGGSKTDQWLANILRMTMFVIVVGYLLVIVKLIEVLGFAAIVTAWILLIRGRGKRHSIRTRRIIPALFYDALEGPSVLRRWHSKARTKVMTLGGIRPKWSSVSFLKLIWLATLGESTYIRFADSFHNPAPAMSDGYVTLAWLKYVNERILFHDGIYPQGMYFTMDLILKLAFINPLYVMKYMGPLDTVFIVIGLFYVTYQLGQSFPAAIIASSIYGIFGHALLFGDWTRQAATNSQEFGFALVLPTILFIVRYLSSGARVELLVAFAGLCSIGFTHPVAYILVVIGTVSAILAQFITSGLTNFARLVQVSVYGIVSAFVIVLPLIMGYVLGRVINSSASSFATSTAAASSVNFPTLHFFDWITLVAIAFLLIQSAIQYVRGTLNATSLFAALFGAVTFLSYEVAGPVTRNEVLITRMVDAYAVVQPFVIGIAIASICSRMGWSRKSQWIQVGMVGAFLIVGFVRWTPQIITPYKLQWNDDVQAYLDINRQFAFSSYMLVAPQEEYDLVLGEGYRMSWGEFTRRYNPIAPPLTEYGKSVVDTAISPDVFIYVPKTIFEVSRKNAIYPLEAATYVRERAQLRQLHIWMSKYESVHGALQVFYSGPHLTVYHIHVFPPKHSQNPIK